MLLVESCVCTSSPMTISHSGARTKVLRSMLMSLQPDVLRSAIVTIGRLLVLMRDIQHLRLGEIVADDLQSDRALLPKPAGIDMPGRPARFTAMV